MGHSLRRAGLAVGVSHQTIKYWEKGDRPVSARLRGAHTYWLMTYTGGIE